MLPQIMNKKIIIDMENVFDINNTINECEQQEKILKNNTDNVNFKNKLNSIELIMTPLIMGICKSGINDIEEMNYQCNIISDHIRNLIYKIGKKAIKYENKNNKNIYRNSLNYIIDKLDGNVVWRNDDITMYYNSYPIRPIKPISYKKNNCNKYRNRRYDKIMPVKKSPFLS